MLEFIEILQNQFIKECARKNLAKIPEPRGNIVFGDM